MPTPLKARMVVIDIEGNVERESAHASFEDAWGMVHRDFFKYWGGVKASHPATEEAFRDFFMEAYKGIRGAFTHTEGEVTLGPSEARLFTWRVETYHPFGKAPEAAPVASLEDLLSVA